jgi:hypothetical protein
MNIFKKLYRDYFGLTEQTTKQHSMFSVTDKDVQNMQKMANAAQQVKKALGEDADLDEAQLLNKISEYRGGVEFVVIDPEQSSIVADNIVQWAAKKGINLIKKTISKSGRVVYLYFRMGQDPVADSQKLQGYISQRPDIKHFRFKVRDVKRPIAPDMQIKQPERQTKNI